MNKMTYKEFEKEMMERNIEVYHAQNMVLVIKENRTIATVPKWSTCRMNTNNLNVLDAMLEEDRIIVAKLCWALASTPLKDREEPKEYYLKVNTKIMPGAPETESYLCVKRDRSRWMILEKFENEYYQTKFTDEEIKGLEEVLDLELFEKVEVEDE